MKSRFSFRLAIFTAIGVSLFTQSALAKPKAVCTNPGLNELEALELEILDIVGTYSEKIFRQTCALSYVDEKGEQQACSATLVKGGQILTSAHCTIPFGGELYCYCGQTENTDGTKTTELVKTNVVSSGVHPDYVSSGILVILGYDIRVAKQVPPVFCDPKFPKLEPMEFAPSIAEAKKLLARGECYFSGIGRDNKGEFSGLHSTHVPKNFAYDTNHDEAIQSLFPETVGKPLTEWVYYLSEPAMAGAEKFIRGISKENRVPKETTDRAVGQMKAEMRPKFAGDPNSKNGVAKGDSGGSLICLDAQGKEFLIGIPSNEMQAAILVNDPQIAAWLKKFGL